VHKRRDDGAPVPAAEQVEKTASEWLMQGFKAMVQNQVRFTPQGHQNGGQRKAEVSDEKGAEVR
jgi:hypothetical protein